MGGGWERGWERGWEEVGCDRRGQRKCLRLTGQAGALLLLLLLGGQRNKEGSEGVEDGNAGADFFCTIYAIFYTFENLCHFIEVNEVILHAADFEVTR